MNSPDPLQDAVNHNNPYGFLISYLDQIKAGRSLILPKQTKESLVRQEWIDICNSLKLNPINQFIEAVSELWTGIASQIPKSASVKKSKDLIDTIIELLKKSQVQSKKQQSEHAAVTHSISSDYYEHEEIKQKKVGSLKQIKAKQVAALKKRDPSLFLEQYLSVLNIGKKPNIPMSTILEEISGHWEDVFMKEFGVDMGDKFLKDITKTWFYLVNHHGLPASQESLDKIRVAISKEVKENKAVQKKLKTSHSKLTGKNFKETKKPSKIIKVIQWLIP